MFGLFGLVRLFNNSLLAAFAVYCQAADFRYVAA